VIFEDLGGKIKNWTLKDVKSYFFTKSARALLLRSVQNQIIHVIYIILISHAKNQPPTTMLSYVDTLLKFTGE